MAQAAGVAARLARAAEEQHITLRDLSRRTGIAHARLRRHLGAYRGALTLSEALAIADALSLDLADMLAA